MSESDAREAFAARQAQMSLKWWEEVQRREADVDAYIARRQRAYLDRWREAVRFVEPRCAVLDIGGGNLFPDLMRAIHDWDIDYYYLDVDPDAVMGSRELGRGFGLDESRFRRGFNDDLPYPEGAFGAVFSSHSIEHSFDLKRTLCELRRVIRPGGNLLVAVPLGWEVNPEHPYFLGAEHWVALLQGAGFDARVAQVGCEYPETGYDLFIAARRSTTREANFRLDPADFRKDSFKFLRFDHPCIAYRGDRRTTDDGGACLIDGQDWEVTIRIDEADIREILPIVTRHDWSGIVEVDDGATRCTHDLYSWFSTVQPIRQAIAHRFMREPRLRLRPVGANPASMARQIALHGLMYR